jgi:hypothetical protein
VIHGKGIVTYRLLKCKNIQKKLKRHENLQQIEDHEERMVSEKGTADDDFLGLSEESMAQREDLGDDGDN